MTSSRNTNVRLSACQRSRQLDETWERVRHLHAGELRAMTLSDDDGQVAAAVRDIREGMARVERQRGQHRADRRAEVLLEESVYVRRAVFPLEKVHPLFGQQWLQLAPARTEGRRASGRSCAGPFPPVPRSPGRRARRCPRPTATGGAGWRGPPCGTRRGCSRRWRGTSRARAAAGSCLAPAPARAS